MKEQHHKKESKARAEALNRIVNLWAGLGCKVKSLLHNQGRDHLLLAMPEGSTVC